MIKNKNKKIVGFSLSMLLFFQVFFQSNVVAATAFGEDSTMPESVSESSLTVSEDEIPEMAKEVPLSMEDQGSDGEKTEENEKSEIIKVVLPTEFAVLMYKQPGGEKMQIESQDILFINKSNVPVNVVIKDIKCEVSGQTISKVPDSALSLAVRHFQKEEYTVPYSAEEFSPLYIGLDAARTETDAEELMKEAEGFNSIGDVISGDYSIVRITGNLGEINVGEKDVKVGLVFELE